MVAIAAMLLASALLADSSVLAVPSPTAPLAAERRALQGAKDGGGEGYGDGAAADPAIRSADHVDVDPVVAAALGPAISQFGVDLVTELTTQLAQNQASGNNQLWFRSFDAPLPSLQRCGEIDAAPYMPASLFEPRNFLKLLAYAEVTVRLYRTPVLDTAVELGRCTGAGYDVCGAGVQGIRRSYPILKLSA